MDQLLNYKPYTLNFKYFFWYSHAEILFEETVILTYDNISRSVANSIVAALNGAYMCGIMQYRLEKELEKPVEKL